MKFYVIAWGKLKESFYREGAEHYIKRIKAFIDIEHIEFKEKRASKKDLDRIVKRLPLKHEIWLLDEKGSLLTTEQFARIIQQRINLGMNALVFLIGGPYGDPLLKEIADKTLSLSTLTFPHRLARLILLEQLYRVMTIIKGTPYNH